MKLVNEYINFERGMDPKESMDIGLFKFHVEYTGDEEHIFDSDKEIAKSWRLNGKSALVFEGSASDEYISMNIKFSDGDILQFDLYREVGPVTPQGKDYAVITINSLEIQELDVQDQYDEYASDGSIIGAILRIYEFFINPVEIKESLDFERGQDPMTAMDIGMFNFDIEFSGDIENMEDDERRIAKKWNHNGVKILEVEGNADEESSELYFKLSDGDQIVFKQRSQPGHSRPDKPDYAKISISNLGVKDFEVFDEWLDELGNGSLIGAIMKMYEDIKDGKMKVHESLDFERGINPKSSMKIGIPTWETLQEGDVIYVQKRTGTKNDNVISEVPGECVEGLAAGAILMVRELDNASTKEWTLRFIYFSDIKDYKENKIEKDRFGYILGTPKQFREKFKLLPRSMSESVNFVRGGNPLDTLNIGNIEYRKREIIKKELINAVKILVYALNVKKESVIEDFNDPQTNIEFKGKYKSETGKYRACTYSIGYNFRLNNYWVLADVYKVYGLHKKDPDDNNVKHFDTIDQCIKQIHSWAYEIPPTIKESINFERGLDPKNSMNIGEKALNKKIIEETIWELPHDIIHQNFDIIKVIRNYKGEPILMMKTKSDGDGDGKKFISMSPDYRSDYYKTSEEATSEVKLYIDNHSTNESLNFERGIDPKSTMNIGKRSMIETWLKEYDLFEDAVINKDLTINIPENVNLVVDLKKKHIEELPPYIQFGKVYGGFNISDNGLKTLRGCPTHVLETKVLKGNFKCYGNKLTSLEFAPKRVDGNFIGYLNPGKFTRKDVTKVCRVKGGTIWVDEVRKVNEVMDFQRNEDPMGNMDIGFHAQVKTWFKSYGIFDPEKESLYFEYRINKDGTIDVLDDINLVGAHIDNFPYFIRFNKIYGGFYVANNVFTSLEGFPKEVDGDLSIYSDQPKAKKWKESEVRKKIKVKGTVWN